MKIIKAGVLKEKVVTYIGICSKCNCVLECDRSELKSKTESFRIGIGEMKRDEVVEYILCPTHNCFNHITPIRKISF